MRHESIQQFAIVKEDSAINFEETLNARIKELADHHPKVVFSEADPFYARISYTETHAIAENEADMYELQGIAFHCEDCPMFDPMRNEDGSVSTRTKYGMCEFARYGKVSKNAQPCEQLFKMIRDGRIGLCWQR